MRRTSKRKLKKIAICLVLILCSPLIASVVVNSIPSISVAAGKIANISAGITLGGNIPLNNDVSPVSESVLPSKIDIDDSVMLSTGSVSDIIPSSTNEDQIVQTNTTDATAGPKPYPTSLEQHSGVISVIQFAASNGTQFFNLEKAGQVRNITSIPNQQFVDESKQKPEFTVDFNGQPQVLIMHTHTTESYEPYARTFYDASFNSRTTDESKSVVSVGNKIQEQLSAAGINVIHDKTIHDYPSYNGSYDRSAVTVKAILAQYPSIKVVLDIHRDAIEKADGTRVAPTVTINGKSAAQVMIISGADNGSMNMPNYKKNFRFASLLEQQMESDYKGLTRPILVAYKKYNQNLTTGSILIEVGGHANSVDEAQYSGELVGKSLVNALESIKTK